MYIFRQDWFTHNIPKWKIFLDKYKNQPCDILEIGSFEGRSTVWLLENILTHEKSSITCIDPFTGNIEHIKKEEQDFEKNFVNNVLMNFSHKVKVYKEFSYDVLKYSNLMNKKFDVIIIDGDHRANSVVEDAVLSFRLLKVGGLMIFDDYGWTLNVDIHHFHPARGMEAFFHSYGHFFDILDVDYQIIARKIKDI